MRLNSSADRQVMSFVRAATCLIYPGPVVLSNSTPYLFGGGVGSVCRRALYAAASAANTVNANYIHLELLAGAESAGPSNVVVAMFRGGTCYVTQTCRFWLDEDGRPFLLTEAGGATATMTFGPEGLNSRLGSPSGDLGDGYERAATKLRELAEANSATSHSKMLKISLAA